MRICDDLRQAVLQAAIQGKLTKQLPEDGDAKDLLKQIAAEKAKLVKEGKIKNEKTLPEIKLDEVPFDIPENWQWSRLLHLAKAISAGGDKPKIFSKTVTDNLTVPVISNGEINDGVFGYTNNATVLEKAVTVSGRGTIGFSKVRKKPFTPIVRLIVITFITDSVDYDYICIALSALLESGIGSAVKQLTVPMIAPKIIPLPPLAEQHRIVALVEELMARIDDLEKTENELENLKAAFPADMKAALLQAAMQGKLTEQLPEDGDAADLLEQIVKEKSQLIKEGKIKKEKPLPEITPDEVPFDIPENWKWERLGNLCSILGGGTPDKNNTNYWNGTIPWATVSDMNNAHIIKTILNISQEGLENSSTNIIKKGSIIVATRVGLGKVCYADIDVAINQDLKGLDFFNICDNDFIFYYFKSMASYIVSKGTGTTVKGIKLDFLTSLLIPLPPLAEQKRIVEKLDKLLPLCDGLIEK